MPASAPASGPAVHPVGIVGVGNMGGGMARNLLRRGWPVHVHDIDTTRQAQLASAGARPHGSARELARQVQVVIVCVVDAAQTREVTLGPDGIAAAGGARTVVLCPTIAPDDVCDIGAALQAQGIGCIDAPMSGGPARAADGSMSLMVAGDAAVVQRCSALLQALSDRLFMLGERLGDGARTKLVNNLLAAANLAGAAEALVLAQRLGLDLRRTLDVIGQSSGQSWIGTDRLSRAIAGDFAPRAHMSLLAKDTALALQAAHGVGHAPVLGAAAAAAFAAALQAGLADEDDAAMFRHLGGQVPRIDP